MLNIITKKLTLRAIEWKGTNAKEVEDFLEDGCFIENGELYIINGPFWYSSKVELGEFVVKDEYDQLTCWQQDTFWQWFEEAD